MFAGIAVFEGNQTFNISHEFPCFLGYSPNKHLPKADVGLLVDVDVPWFPADVTHKDKSFWAHIDVDTLKSASPMWTFPGNLRMQGDSGVILGQLLEELKKKATPKFKEAAARSASRRTPPSARPGASSAAKLATNKGKPGEINPHYLFAELNKLLKADDIVCNEGVRNAGACLLQLERPHAEHLRALRRRRARLVRRHGARRQARGARQDGGAGGRRRRLLFRRPELGVRGGEAIQAADPGAAARQHRLVGGEGIDAAGVPGGRGQVDGQVPGRA